jgi:hypothetical protein
LAFSNGSAFFNGSAFLALGRDDADREDWEDWRATVTSVVGLGVRAHQGVCGLAHKTP